MGGLNDVLCQIEQCSRYAERFERHLIVDFQNNELLTRFFAMLDQKPNPIPFTIRGIDPDPTNLNDLDAFPYELSKKVDTYEVAPKHFGDPSQRYEKNTGVAIEFDFGKDYAEPLLIHHRGGGGTASFQAIAKFSLSDKVKDAVRESIAFLPENYSAAQIRATDYTVDFEQALMRLRRKVKTTATLICSDNNAVLELAEKLGFLTFGRLPVAKGTPLHVPNNEIPSETSSELGIRLLNELVALARAKTLYVPFVKERHIFKKPRISGFTVFVSFVHENSSRLPLFSWATSHSATGIKPERREIFLGNWVQIARYRIRLIRRKVRRITKKVNRRLSNFRSGGWLRD